MQVRLLASGPVRSAALAVHVLLQQLHGQMNPSSTPGVQPETHFREMVAQVPLVMQQFEAEIREGSWYVVRAEPGDPVSADPEGLWPRVLRRQGGSLALVSGYPIDPATN